MNVAITLTTDMGLNDSYVAEMKGVILSINPEVKLVDICHFVSPQNIHQAAFILGRAYPFFPERTIHLVVVDPGVGTERRAIIMRTRTADFVAPDNGVLSYVIRQFSGKVTTSFAKQVELNPDIQAVAITNPKYWRSPVSATFHGRDIFAPVAAYLSLGYSPVDFGESVKLVNMLPLSQPYQAADGTLKGHIIHIDSFGNIITDIREGDLLSVKQPVTIRIKNQSISGLSCTYAARAGLLALIGSSGYLEIALNRGNAHDFLKAEVGDEISLG